MDSRLEDSQHARVIHPGQRVVLEVESPHHFIVMASRQDELDRAAFPGLGMARGQNHRHAPAANLFDHLVVPDSGARRRNQRGRTDAHALRREFLI